MPHAASRGAIGSISIQYRAFVKNADTGEIIPPDTSVPVGTNLQFVFDQHQSSDIYWFATGGYMDSPYGDWGNPDVAPPIACADKDFLSINPDPNNPVGNDIFYDNYVPFIVNAPGESIDGISNASLSCGSLQNGVQACTAVKEGAVPALFNFSGTTGKMYARYFATSVSSGNYRGPCTGLVDSPVVFKTGAWWAPGGSSWMMWAQLPGDTTDHVDVPQQSIAYSLTVVSADGHPPTNPSVSSLSIGDENQCTVGTPYTITMTATDSDGNQIKYGIDWNNDGSIDQFVPSSGYVPSGTTETASRTYSTEGPETVKVIAIDSNGLSSGWTSFSFTCSAVPMCPLDEHQSGNSCLCNADNSVPVNGQCPDTCPAGQYNGASGVCLCVADNSTPVGGLCGSGTNGNGNGGNGSGTASLEVSAEPSLVRSGETTNIFWSASSVVSCAVLGTNGDGAGGAAGWTGAASPSAGALTSPITSQTTYTLSCTALDGSILTQNATVNLIPAFQEK